MKRFSLLNVLEKALATLATIAVGFAAAMSGPASAANGMVDETTMTWVAVNGAGDTANPGTTCVKVSSPVSGACANGMVAIQNNNKPLISAAMHAKATGSKILFYYEDASVPQHCPGLVFTPCTVISIVLK